jgi:dienelactone hydrolase
VFLIDADSGSPTAFERVAVDVLWSPQLSRLALRPAMGQSLTPGRRYAALVTRRVRDLAGRALEPAAKFASVRDPSVSLTDARLLQARAEYTPVLETLAKMNTPREDVVAMAVFRVQTVTPDLDAARRMVRAPRAAPTPTAVVAIAADGLDSVLGARGSSATAAPHQNLQAMIHGTLPTPNFVSATAKIHGAWTHGITQELELKRSDEQVPFTLFVPKGNEPAPIVIYQHQRGHERSDAVVVANALALQNIAVIAIDAPFQGLRARSTSSKAVDSRNRFTGADTPDGFGDEQGDFYGAQDAMGSLVPMHPFYVRDALRQGVVDLMNVVRFIEEGDLAAFTADANLARRFAQRRFGFVGEDVGAQMGVMLATVEPKVSALALVGAGAFVSEGLWLGATDQPLFAQLSSWLGRDPSRVDFANDPPSLWPELGLFETLMGRGETLAYAAALRRSPVNVLLMMAAHDETVANLSTEALSSALGAQLLGGSSGEANDGDTVKSTFPVEDNLVLRLLNNYDPADHQLLQAARGQRLYEDPVEAPFQRRETPDKFDNPREAALDMLTSYFSSFFECVGASDSATTTTPCGADVTVYR